MLSVGDLVWYSGNKHKIPPRPDKGVGIITKVWENKDGKLLYRVRWQKPENFIPQYPNFYAYQLVKVDSDA